MIKFIRDDYGSLYYRNDINGDWCLIVCQLTNVDCANTFIEDNPDCGIITEIYGFIFIAFIEDLGISGIK